MNKKNKPASNLVKTSSAESIEIVRTEDSYVFDSHGNCYIDFVSGWCVGNLGWNNETIQGALQEYQGPDYVSPSFIYRRWEELAALLLELAPRGLKKCFRATGGTEAVDIALQAARLYTGRPELASLDGCYHGNSLATLALMGPSKEGPKPVLKSHLVHPPLDAKALHQLERFLKTKKIAAFILEPIPLNLGVAVPSTEFMTEAAKLCKHYGTLLILDEVATGFGRTGKIFAAEHYHLQPDILCLAKAITGGYAALGATLVTEEIARTVAEKGNFYSTYGWHPRSVEASIANLKYFAEHWTHLENSIEELGTCFLERLSDIFSHIPSEIRVRGLAIAVEFFHGKHASQLAELARSRGLLISDHSEKILTLFPALTIDPEVALKGLDILEECVRLSATKTKHAA